MSNIDYEERAYRRGCHQTAAMINYALAQMDNPDEIKAFLKRLEDELYRIRMDRQGEYPDLLHAAIVKAGGKW